MSRTSGLALPRQASLPSARLQLDILKVLHTTILDPQTSLLPFSAAAVQLIHGPSSLACGLKQAARIGVYGA